MAPRIAPSERVGASRAHHPLLGYCTRPPRSRCVRECVLRCQPATSPSGFVLLSALLCVVCVESDAPTPHYHAEDSAHSKSESEKFVPVTAELSSLGCGICVVEAPTPRSLSVWTADSFSHRPRCSLRHRSRRSRRRKLRRRPRPHRRRAPSERPSGPLACAARTRSAAA